MPRTQSATLVIGAEISNESGGRIGQIQDLIVDLKSGLVIYAIVSFNQKIETGDKYYPIPVKAIKEDPEEVRIFLDIEKEQLNDAPSFSEKKWPKNYEEEFVQSVYNHYGYDIPDR